MSDLQIALRLIGSDDEDEKIAFLTRMLNDENGGNRSAAAASLGAMGQLGILGERLRVEENKFVISVISSWFRHEEALPSAADVRGILRPPESGRYLARSFVRSMKYNEERQKERCSCGLWPDQTCSRQPCERGKL